MSNVSWRDELARSFSPGKIMQERFEKASAGPTHSRTRRRSPSSTRATLPSRLFPTARYRPQPPARSPASHRPARNAPRRLAAHENANRRDVCRARCRLLVGLGRTSRGRAAARGRAMRPRVERASGHCRDGRRLDPNRYAPPGRRGYASLPTAAAASSNISSDASESESRDCPGPGARASRDRAGRRDARLASDRVIHALES